MSSVDPREFGALEGQVRALQRDVDDIRKKLDHLLSLAERGRGVWIAALAIASIIGSLVTTLGKHWLR